jgi:hypothetical protein
VYKTCLDTQEEAIGSVHISSAVLVSRQLLSHVAGSTAGLDICSCVFFQPQSLRSSIKLFACSAASYSDGKAGDVTSRPFE